MTRFLAEQLSTAHWFDLSAARRDLEQRTDEICAQMWRSLGEDRTVELCESIEPHHDTVLAMINSTAGPNWMPAARQRI